MAAEAGVPNATPSIAAAARNSQRLFVAWRSTDEKLYVTSFWSVGNNPRTWTTNNLGTVSLDLPLLGGLALNESGVLARVLAFQDDSRPGVPWRNQYQAATARLYDILSPEGSNPQLRRTVELNQREFSTRPLTKPVRWGNSGTTNSQVVLNQGTTLLAFAHDDVASPGRPIGSLIGVRADGTAAYAGGGRGTALAMSVAQDGDGFVVAQLLPEGIGLSKVIVQDQQLVWSDHVLVHPVEDTERESIQIAGIAPSRDGYRVVFTRGQGSSVAFARRSRAPRSGRLVIALRSPSC